MANALNVDVDVYANLDVCTCRVHCCPSTGVYRGASVSSVDSFYFTRLTAWIGTYGFSNTTLAVAFDQSLRLFPSPWLMEF